MKKLLILRPYMFSWAILCLAFYLVYMAVRDLKLDFQAEQEEEEGYNTYMRVPLSKAIES